MKQFPLDIITPARTYREESINYLRCPGIDGLFGVLADHADAVIAVNLGEVKVEKDSGTDYYATSGGYAEISRSGVKLLLETAEKASDIDLERATRAAERAKERLSQDAEIDYVRASSSLDKALNRIKIVNL